MTNEEKQAWLVGLKAGDKVVCERGQGYRIENVATVLSTTATIVRVSSESSHVPHIEYRRKDGQKRGGEWHQRIKPLTPDAAERIEHKNLIDRLESVKWGEVSTSVLRSVLDLVRTKST